MATRLALPPALGAILAIALGAAGCGGDEEDGATSAAPATGTVEVVDFAFEPQQTSVKAGTTVTWNSTGDEIHNVKGPGFFSEALGPGETYQHRFSKPGTYRYLCTLHPTQMRGAIEVER